MIIDKQLELSNAQVVTATAVSTNVIDQGAARTMINMEDAKIVVTVEEAATAAGAATVTFQISSSAAEGMGSPTTVSLSSAIGKADLTLGKQYAFAIPPELTGRFLQGNYVVATGPLLTGKFSMHITNGAGAYKAYPQSASI